MYVIELETFLKVIQRILERDLSQLIEENSLKIFILFLTFWLNNDVERIEHTYLCYSCMIIKYSMNK